MVTEQEIIEELHGLDPSRWLEVQDFIAFLKHRVHPAPPQEHTRQLTARDLLNSGLVGLWADREDIGDTISFARELRRRAERRGEQSDAAR